MDGNLYSMNIDTLRYLYDKITPGGYCILDDYFSWPSCHRAVHDFLKERNITDEIRRIDTEGAFWKVYE